MGTQSTGMFSTLKLLYKNYGGWSALVRSEYAILSAIFTALSWRAALNDSWVDTAKSILPTLAGFTIAAYAIFFVVLSEKDRETLSKPSDRLSGRAPLPVLISSVSHAVVIQVFAIVIAIIYGSKPFPTMKGFEYSAICLDFLVSIVGQFLTFYGIILVLASVLSIFRIIESKSKTATRPPPASTLDRDPKRSAIAVIISEEDLQQSSNLHH